MPPVPPTLHALLDIATEIATEPKFDPQATIKLLTLLPTGELDVPTCVAIQRATESAVAARDGGIGHANTARFHLMRVVVLLEGRSRLSIVGNGTGS